jgi:acetoin utilization deacetylase AcuC-like enzyme
VYSPLYPLRLGGTPIDDRRSEKILSFLLGQGLIGRRHTHPPEAPSLRTLQLVHTVEYLEKLHQPGSLVPIVGYDVGDDLQQRALEAQRLAVGGTRLATRLALQRGGLAFNLGGGFHHARPGAGRGFCIFNDVAVAIAAARDAGFLDPILVIDLDLHDGDGTRAAFANDPTVFTFSIHNRNWDLEPATASLSIELPGEVEDQTYLDTLHGELSRLVETVQPGLVYYLAGTDPAFDDRLGNWRISATGLLGRDRYVVEELESRLEDVPLVILLAGGYGNNTWRYTARFLAWLLADREIEPPSNEAATLARYRRLFETLTPRQFGGEESSASDGTWDISHQDIYGDLMGPKRSQRFLGYFSPHGVELALERSGFLDRLRQTGFSRPQVEFDLENPAGETVRIYGDPSHRDLLVEVRLRRDLRSVPKMRLLSLEWLLMQNPQARFTPDRKRLPGQNHPGLGLLSDMMALLVLISEKLQFDGISFVPSHYHLAIKGKRYLRFLKPEDEAWFGAVRDAVRGLSLRTATRAVEEGQLVDGENNPVAWRPMLMVIPLSARLRHLVGGSEYQTSLQALRDRYRFRLEAETG